MNPGKIQALLDDILAPDIERIKQLTGEILKVVDERKEKGLSTYNYRLPDGNPYMLHMLVNVFIGCGFDADTSDNGAYLLLKWEAPPPTVDDEGFELYWPLPVRSFGERCDDVSCESKSGGLHGEHEWWLTSL